jgi:hypothetical protein
LLLHLVLLLQLVLLLHFVLLFLLLLGLLPKLELFFFCSRKRPLPRQASSNFRLDYSAFFSARTWSALSQLSVMLLSPWSHHNHWGLEQPGSLRIPVLPDNMAVVVDG